MDEATKSGSAQESEETTGAAQTSEGTAGEQGGEKSVEELMEELAAERVARQKAEADATKRKSDLDDALKRLGDKTKQLRAKQTTEEQEKEAIAEQREAEIRELEETKKELDHMKAVAAYKDIDDSETVELLISAVADRDHAAIATIISNERKKQKKADDAEWKASRPAVNAGSGASSMTKEEIFAIKDAAERQRAIARNIELFS